ncbi:MAG: hypothetical protein D6B27_12015 [Gammaproteobacteria bacterium]|nr:MAG: hypothetical protein D6B27_12015 [Gammaproteobacteria bacterium]
MFWIWMTEAQSEADARIYTQPEIISTYGLDFDSGRRPQAKNIPTIEIYKPADQNQLTDNLIAPGVTGIVINRKVYSIFEKNNINNIDYYDAVVIDEITAKKEANYKVGNIIGLIKCINFEKSELVLDDQDGSIEFIDKLVLNEDYLKEIKLKIFRLEEFPPIIIVDDLVKKELESANISGINFYKPEEFVL